MNFDLYQGLSNEQKSIVDSKAKKIVVVSGPGTGKSSRGIMRRIARQLNEDVAPGSIKLLSFTRVAAQDLKEKVKELDIQGADEIDASTVHSMCLKYLYREGILEQYRRTDRFLFDHEKDLMLYDIDDANTRVTELRQTLREFESAWTTDEEAYQGHRVPSSQENDFQSLITAWMIDHKSMIIGEVVPLTVKVLSTMPAEDVFPEMKHLIVDEYQDLNYLEQKFLDSISRSLDSLLLVGDDDQSIYSFKHANPDRIRELAREEDLDTEVITMVTCRRSPAPIVKLGNQLMSHAPSRAKDAMEFDEGRNGYVASVSWSNLDDEVAGITAAIATAIRARDIAPGDILVLTPNRKIGGLILERLQDLDIPSQGFFDQSMFKGNDRAQKAMAMVDLCVDESDPLAWRVLWGLGARKGGSEPYRALRGLASQRKTPVTELFDNPHYSQETQKNFRRTSSIFREVKNQIEEIDKTNPVTVVRGIKAAFEDDAKMAEFFAVVDGVVNASDVEEDLESFARRLRSELSYSTVPEESDKVRVMTLHKSKGLTAKCVFVCGLVEGLVPNTTGRVGGKEEIDAVDEGRRLLYVAITRAAAELVLSRFRLIDSGLGRSMGLSPTGHYQAGNRPFPVTHSRFYAELSAVLGPAIGGTEFDREYAALPPLLD